MLARARSLSNTQSRCGLAAAIAVTTLLAGCAEGTVREPDARLPVAYEAAQPPEKADPEALDHWWTLYQDAQLTELVEQALRDGPDARDAASRLQQALAVRASALDSYNPQGQLTGSASKSKYYPVRGGALGSLGALGGLGGASGLGATGGLPANESYSLGFNVSWELDLFGRRAAARRSADADLQTARFTYEATRWSLTANVAESLFQARGLAIQLDQAQQTLRIEQQLYDISKARADHGLAPSSDTAQTLANVQAAEAQAQDLTAQLTAARRQLLLLVGRGVDPLASMPTPAQVGATPPVPSAVPGELLARRPDVRAAQARIEAAAGKLALDKRALLPTFTLQPGGSLLQEATSANQALGLWTLAANAAVPVLDRHRLLAQARQQGAVAEQAVLAYEKAVQSAYGDAETAFTFYDSDKKRVAVLTEAEKNAGFAYEAKRTGYSRGLNDLQTALTAEANWRQARLSLASAEVTLMQRSVQVFKALGGGWRPPPVKSANNPGAGAAG